MLNFSTAIERTFQPRYSFSWYLTNLFVFITAGAYLTSKALGEKTDGFIESIGIGSLIAIAFLLARTLKAIEFGPNVKLRYILWPAQNIAYKDILEIRLPEIAVNSRNPIKLENIANLDELQQEFKSLELMGVIPRGHISELKLPASQYIFKPGFRNIFWALLTMYLLGAELLRVSQKGNILWIGIVAIYFLSDLFNKLFRKPKDE